MKLNSDRMQKVLSGLLPETDVQNVFGKPARLTDRLRYFHTPGISIAVINNFEVEWTAAIGNADAKTGQRVTTNTCFLAGSISKLVTAIGVMRLAQDGVIDLDRDVNHYLKSWRVPAKDSWQPTVTARQILSHSAGLTVHGFLGYHKSEAIPTIPQILNGTAPANSPKVEINGLPGIQFRYSGGGTTVLQLLLTDVLQKSFPTLMHELVLDPLRLKNSTFEQPLPRQWRHRVSTAHPWKGVPLTGRFHTYPEMAAAGLWTTAGDLATLGSAMLKTFSGKKTQLNLSRETIEQMLQPQLPSQKGVKGEHAGLGLFCNDAANGIPFWHYGGDEGFVAVLRAHKESGKGAVVMVNSNEGWPLLDEVLRAVAHEYKWTGYLPAQRPTLKIKKLDEFVGHYVGDHGLVADVRVSSSRLLLNFQQQNVVPLTPTSLDTFFIKDTNTVVEFVRASRKRVVALKILQEGVVLKARKRRSQP
jgi:CubicO group peptidase (beta-lactamase class C family)